MSVLPRAHRTLAAATRLVLLCNAICGLVPATNLGAQTIATVNRIAIIDTRVIMQAMPGRAQAQSAYALDLSKAREMVHAATDSIKAAVDELAKHEADMRPQLRDAATMMVRARELVLEDMVGQLNAITATRLRELQAPLLAQIRDAVKLVRQRERFALVIDLAATDAIVDMDDAVSINDEVLVQLRKPQASPARQP